MAFHDTQIHCCCNVFFCLSAKPCLKSRFMVLRCRSMSTDVTALVRMSETFSSPGILCIDKCLSAMRSCIHRKRVCTCLIFPRPRRLLNAKAADESLEIFKRILTLKYDFTFITISTCLFASFIYHVRYGKHRDLSKLYIFM